MKHNHMYMYIILYMYNYVVCTQDVFSSMQHLYTSFLTVCSWLFACAKIGSIAPVEEHLLTPPPPPDHQTDPGGGAADLETAGGGEEETEVESDGRATESAPVERQPTVEGAELVVQGETATDNDGDLPAMDASTMSGDTPFKEFIPKFNLTVSV